MRIIIITQRLCYALKWYWFIFFTDWIIITFAGKWNEDQNVKLHTVLVFQIYLVQCQFLVPNWNFIQQVIKSRQNRRLYHREIMVDFIHTYIHLITFDYIHSVIWNYFVHKLRLSNLIVICFIRFDNFNENLFDCLTVFVPDRTRFKKLTADF